LKECWKCGWFYNEKTDFCPDCGTENFDAPDYSKPHKNPKGKDKDPFGAWILIHNGWFNQSETNPPLYTRIVTDDIKHKATGKKYRRGKYKLFWASRGETPPQLIEDTNEFRIVYHKSIFERIVIKE